MTWGHEHPLILLENEKFLLVPPNLKPQGQRSSNCQFIGFYTYIKKFFLRVPPPLCFTFCLDYNKYWNLHKILEYFVELFIFMNLYNL